MPKAGIRKAMLAMFLAAASGATTSCSSAVGPAGGESAAVGDFEARLAELQTRYHVPGMSAIVDGPAGTVWEHAYGFANLAAKTPVTPATLFHLASLTKPFAAVLAMQLQQEGKLDIDALASKYGIKVPDSVRIWHLMSHTSESTPPGTAYRYSGNRYGMIETALASAGGRTFAQLFDERIRKPIGLDHTVPNPGSAKAFRDIGLDPATYTRDFAQGYAYDASAGYKPVNYDPYFGPAAGLIATPRDIVAFSRAVDDGRLVSEAMRTRMWTPIRTPSGKTLPYALGWFVQKYNGETVVWHYGLWTGASALIVKVPARRLTFVVLGNSPMLSMPFPLGDGDLMTSPFASLFLRTFVK